MKKSFLPFHAVRWVVSVALVAGYVGSYSEMARSQISSPTINPFVFNDPTPPEQGTPDGRGQGTAGRGPCQDHQNLTALVPVVTNKVWGLTATERPTFWFYLPAPINPNTPFEFVLQDQQSRYVYRQRFTQTIAQPGLIRISLPVSAPALENGQSYLWTLVIYCGTAAPSNSIFVQGTVQRRNLDPSTQRQLAAATPFERARLYAANGIWHETLTALAELRQANPRDPQVVDAWNQLLQRMNLGNLGTAPVSNCCMP